MKDAEEEHQNAEKEDSGAEWGMYILKKDTAEPPAPIDLRPLPVSVDDLIIGTVVGGFPGLRGQSAAM